MKLKYFFSMFLAALAGFAIVTAASAEIPNINTRQLLDKVAAAKGKVVMLNFFSADCPPCRLEIPGLITIKEEFPADQFEIIGVAVDHDLNEMKRFVESTPFNYPVYYGGAEISYAFGINAIPHNVVYNQAGKIIVNEPGLIREEHLREFLQSLLNKGRSKR